MKIRTKPQEYDAVEFKDDIEVCFEIQEFIKDLFVKLICEPERKILSTVIGNTILEDGDIIYKGSDLFVSVIKKGKLFDKYFEVIT